MEETQEIVEQFYGITNPVEKIKLIDGKYVCERSGEYIYKRYEKKYLYYGDGKFAKEEIEYKDTVYKEKAEIIECNYSIIQYDFDFLELPIGHPTTIPETDKCFYSIQDSFEGLNCFNICEYELHALEKQFKEKTTKEDKKRLIQRIGLHDDLTYCNYNKIGEFCYYGGVRKTISTIVSNKICEDYEQYAKNKLEAIKKWPLHRSEIEKLYNTNMALINLKNEIKPLSVFSINTIKDEKSKFGYSFDIDCLLDGKDFNRKIKLNNNSDIQKFEDTIKTIENRIYFFSNEQQEMIYKTKMFIHEVVDKKLEENKEKNIKKHYVTYILKSEILGSYKIGKSSKWEIINNNILVEDRIVTLTSHVPDLEQIKVYDADIENKLHYIFREVRVKRKDRIKKNQKQPEYFYLTDAQVRFICTLSVDEIIEYYNTLKQANNNERRND